MNALNSQSVLMLAHGSQHHVVQDLYMPGRQKKGKQDCLQCEDPGSNDGQQRATVMYSTLCTACAAPTTYLPLHG